LDLSENTPFDLPTAYAEVFALLTAWGLPRADAEYTLKGAVSLRQLRPREVLYAQGQPVTHIYLLQSGRLFQDRLTTGADGTSRVSLRREVAAGQMIGQYDLLYSRGHTTRVRALDPCNVVCIDAAALDRLLYQRPEMRNKIAPATVVARMRTFPFFAQLDPASFAFLAEVCEQREYADGENIYKATDLAQHLYLIDTGQVHLTQPSGPEGWLGNGMEVGILDEVVNNPGIQKPVAYGHSARAVGRVALFCWPRQAIIDLTGINPERTGHELSAARAQTVQTAGVFSKFTTEQRNKLIGYMSHYYFPIPHFVMQQGENGDSLWMLMPGSVGTLRAMRGPQPMHPMTVHGPNYYSEESLKADTLLDSTVEADSGSQWLRLHKEDFHAFLDETDSSLMSALTLGPTADNRLGRAKERKRYGWLEPGEILLRFERRHWVYLLRKMMVPLVMLMLLVAVIVGISYVNLEPVWEYSLTAPFALVASAFFLWHLVDYLNDYILVTNQRVVHQEKVILMTEWRKAAFLEQVRNVDIATSFFGRLLGYGSINVQTAATEGSIVFDYLPDPHGLKQLILEEQTRRLGQYKASTKMVIQTLLQERLGMDLTLPPRVTSDGERDGRRVRTSWRHRAQELQHKLSAGHGGKPRDLIVWRKHWLVLTGKIFMPLSLLIFLLMILSGQRFIPASLHQAVAALDMVLTVVAVLAVLRILWNIADWHNDTYELDYKQIADVSKKPLFFSEHRRTAILSEIENVEVSVPSPINYLFNFGNVRIQTAATEGEFTFDWVADPRGVSREIWRRIELYRQRQEDQRARQRAEELPDWFEMYDRMGVDVQGNAMQ
jgi:CRP-like cAMP-binding protein